MPISDRAARPARRTETIQRASAPSILDCTNNPGYSFDLLDEYAWQVRQNRTATPAESSRPISGAPTKARYFVLSRLLASTLKVIAENA